MKFEKIQCIRMGHLTYYLNSKKKITLDIFEAEYYDAAVVVQQLVGNLVYFSNHGKYEPRLAESWERYKPNSWRFKLKKGFKCENGEEITTSSFKKSLERMIFHAEAKGGSPVFSNLVGYNDFIKNKELGLKGISSEIDFLYFNFDKPLSGGLIEVLSFAPYGYICEDNLSPDGGWKDPQKFISSGPYKVHEFTSGDFFELRLRAEWNHIAKPTAPRKVTIVQANPDSIKYDKTVILDTNMNFIREKPANLLEYQLIPEYLNSIIFGNLEKGFFSSLKNRKALRQRIVFFRDQLPDRFGIHFKSSEFYSVVYNKSTIEKIEFESFPENPLVIEGNEPDEESFKYHSWQLLKKTLESENISYRFASNDPSWKNLRSNLFDIRLRGTSIGGSADVWGIDVLFCSMIGPNYPDPGGEICELVKKYQNELIDQSFFESEFIKSVNKNSAIIPVSHSGTVFYLAPNIKQTSISPTLVVLRFDQLEID